MLIDILIPTYQRASCIAKNLRHLHEQITKYGLEEKCRIIVSNNGSTDSTEAEIARFIATTDMPGLVVHLQSDENVGLEKNVVKLALAATSDFVLWCGDDDYLADGYLPFVVASIQQRPGLGCVIPGLSSLHQNGDLIAGRVEDYETLVLEPGFESVHGYSHLGHQMSGLVLKRDNYIADYLAETACRNPYLFIYFVANRLLRHQGIYAPKYKTLVTVFNEKDWSYNGVGLLDEVFKSYRALHGTLSNKQIDDLFLRFVVVHSYRLAFRPLRPRVLLSQYQAMRRMPGVSKALKWRLGYLFVREFTASLLK